MVRDRERLNRIQAVLTREKLDALVCRLPENLVLTTCYWPVIGRSAAVIPAEGEPVLLAPGMESEPLRNSGVEDIRTFRVWHVTDPSPEESLRRLLQEVASERKLVGRRIGIEENFDDISPTQKILEPWTPGPLSRKIVADAFGENLVDATPFLAELRARKTPYELQRIRIAAEIATFGAEAFARGVSPGRRDADVAAEVEHEVMARGIGYQGVRHARAQAVVFSGIERLQLYSWGFTWSSPRAIERGDLVMLELAVVADGYYADLTRMRAAGTITTKVQDAYDAVREAHAAAMRAVRPGAASAAVDAAARDVLRKRGYGDAFVHHTGHGLGFRYHEAIPFLHPESRGVLEEGMVTSIEPGVYGSGYGGIRIEDDVVVSSSGPLILTNSSRDLV